jgi:hypothetical protein
MLLDPEPLWSFAASKQLHLWYGHVHLLPEYAVGQSFVVNRNTGKCLWERQFQRANNIFEIVDGVILADEMRSDGPWTAILVVMGFHYQAEKSCGNGMEMDCGESAPEL